MAASIAGQSTTADQLREAAQQKYRLTSFCTLDNVTDFKLDPIKVMIKVMIKFMIMIMVMIKVMIKGPNFKCQ